MNKIKKTIVKIIIAFCLIKLNAEIKRYSEFIKLGPSQQEYIKKDILPYIHNVISKEVDLSICLALLQSLGYCQGDDMNDRCVLYSCFRAIPEYKNLNPAQTELFSQLHDKYQAIISLENDKTSDTFFKTIIFFIVNSLNGLNELFGLNIEQIMQAVIDNSLYLRPQATRIDMLGQSAASGRAQESQLPHAGFTAMPTQQPSATSGVSFPSHLFPSDNFDPAIIARQPYASVPVTHEPTQTTSSSFTDFSDNMPSFITLLEIDTLIDNLAILLSYLNIKENEFSEMRVHSLVDYILRKAKFLSTPEGIVCFVAYVSFIKNNDDFWHNLALSYSEERYFNSLLRKYNQINQKQISDFYIFLLIKMFSSETSPATWEDKINNYMRTIIDMEWGALIDKAIKPLSFFEDFMEMVEPGFRTASVVRQPSVSHTTHNSDDSYLQF